MYVQIEDSVTNGREALAAARAAAERRKRLFSPPRPKRAKPETILVYQIDPVPEPISEPEGKKKRKPPAKAIPTPELVYMEEGGDFEFVAPVPFEMDVQARHRDWLNLATENKRLQFRDVLIFCALHFEVDRRDLMGPRRTRDLMHPRQCVAWLAYRYCKGLSLPQIGRFLGGRDHTTILHAVRQVDLAIAAGNEAGREAKETEAGFLECMRMRGITVEARHDQ